nr:nitrous oxide reductase accessory protein NosL [Saprospiraceae bacterium]
MKWFISLLFSTMLFMGCTVEPRPINFGHDECEFCKMKLMDERFGGQLVTDKGRIYMFDDVNCMVMFMEDEENQRHEYAYELIVDYSNPTELLDVHYTYFIKSNDVRTPMNSKIIALPDEETKDHFTKELDHSIFLGWGEVKTQFK